MEESKIHPLHALIAFYASELYNECVVNRDSSNFWEKSNDHIFLSPLVSFKTALNEFHKSLGNEKNMYNYFVTMFVRAFAQPYTKPALKEFGDSFNEVVKDPIFGSAVDFTFNDLSPAEQLLLFFSVHRDQISLAVEQKKQLIAEENAIRRNRK